MLNQVATSGRDLSVVALPAAVAAGAAAALDVSRREARTLAPLAMQLLWRRALASATTAAAAGAAGCLLPELGTARMGDTATIAAARAKYSKQDGYLYLTDAPHRVIWVNASTKLPELMLAADDITNLLASKSGVSPAKLRVVALGVEYNFIFSGPEPANSTDRDAFKDRLKPLLRASMQAKTPSATTPTPLKPESAPPTTKDSPAEVPTNTSQTLSLSKPKPAAPRPVSAAPPENVPSPQTPTQSQQTLLGLDPVKLRLSAEYSARKELLKSNPELAALHAAVVLRGSVTEADFWAHRQQLLQDALVARSQKKGKASVLIDPRPGGATSGTMKVTMTPATANAIFESWPVVERAFRENVPGSMSEGEFWKRYFESRLYHNHQASVRSSATQHVIKEDSIFDKYLEPIDDELEPRHARNDSFSLGVGLTATQEDHMETGNTNDVTMQAGRQRAILPLIRKFNEHSERLLNSALGEVRPVKRRRLNVEEPEVIYDEIVIEDLNEDHSHEGIALDMKNRQRYFEGRAGETKDSSGIDTSDLLQMMGNGAGDWKSRLVSLRQNPDASKSAVKSMSKNVKARLAVKTTKSDVSKDFLEKMKLCEATTNEYLRHFWSAVYPPLDSPTVAPVKDRAAKAASMVQLLEATSETVTGLVQKAAGNNWDSAKVEQAFQPLLSAVDKALGYWAQRQ